MYLVAGFLIALWLPIAPYGVTGVLVFLVTLGRWGSPLQERWAEATATQTHSAVTTP